MRRAGFLFLSLLFFSSAAPAAVVVNSLRQWQAPDHTRLVFDLSGPVQHRLTVQSAPPRVVVELEGAVLREALPGVEAGDTRLAEIRVGTPSKRALQVTLDLKRELRPRGFALKPAGPYGHRLVIDLYDAAAGEEDDGKRAEPVVRRLERTAKREFLIAIDAGHGGEDPGAIGRRYRTREKDVTLAIARELARLVAATPGMRPVLTRSGDYYVGLRDRFARARRQSADIFVSIHADAVPGAHAKGSSVYVLSERGATSAMAKVLADRENAADLIGGVSLSDKDNVLARVLLDLSHTATIQDSLELGEHILGELRRVGPVHLSRVQQAGFMVLKSPDIPSVLVETAFISNPTEEKKLRTAAFQHEVATGILAGIRRYLATQKAPGVARPVVAQSAPPAAAGRREHLVRRGDTLASIARQYNVHVDVLRFFNELRGNDLEVGMRLRIPPAEGG